MTEAGWVLFLVGALLASVMFGWAAFVPVLLVVVGGVLIGAS